MKCFYRSNILVLLLLTMSIRCFSQEKKIVKILNEALRKEIKYQLKNPGFNGDTIAIVQEFSISPDKILSIEVKKSNDLGYMIERQEVPLSKIKIIGKDINIILETEGDEVKTRMQRCYKNEEKQVFFSERNMFFTHLYFPDNEHIGHDLIKAFSKAGYNLTKNYWYD